MTQQEKVALTGAQETMLGTLYLRAEASRAPDPVLVDPAAERAVERLDYDISKMKLHARDAISVAVRAKSIDRWAAEQLAKTPDVTVLHLGCGLDSRSQRLDLPDGVRWYDIDFPDVIELRRKLYDERENHHTIASSVTNPNLLDDIPGDRPVLVIAEGLTMYLSEQDGVALLRRIVDHFPSGTMIFDVFSHLGVRLSNRFNRVVVAAGAHLNWGINDSHELETAVPGLILDREWSYGDAPEIARYGWFTRRLIDVFELIPALRRMGRILRYRF